MRPFITDVQVLSGHRLSVRFNDDETVIKKLDPLFEIGNLYSELADEKLLSQVQISECGRSLVWPNGIEFCADALKLSGKRRKSQRRTAVRATNEL